MRTDDTWHHQQREVKVGESPLLLLKFGGKFYATGSKCTHYGAPLVKGILTSTGRLFAVSDSPDSAPPRLTSIQDMPLAWSLLQRQNWRHRGCCSLTSQVLILVLTRNQPAVDSLLSFTVTVEGDDVYVHAAEDEIKRNQQPPCKSRSAQQDPGVVIVGGGAGGWATAEELCYQGYKGKMTILTKEPHPPIDRTKLSKAFITDAGKITLRSPEQLKSMDITIKHVGAASIDRTNKKAKLEDGSDLPYSQLVLSPGAHPVRVPIDGVNLGNIYTLREIADAQAVTQAVGQDQSKDVVIVGGSFIGTEAATALLPKSKSVTVIEPAYPMKAVLGEAVAKRLVALHEEKGVKFVIGQGSVKKFVASSKNANQVGQAILDNGNTIPADVVLLATGVKPATDFLRSSFELQKDGGIDVEYVALHEPSNKQCLRTLCSHNLLARGESDIFAIGDIARFEDISSGFFGSVAHLCAFDDYTDLNYFAAA